MFLSVYKPGGKGHAESKENGKTDISQNVFCLKLQVIFLAIDKHENAIQYRKFNEHDDKNYKPFHHDLPMAVRQARCMEVVAWE